MQYLIFIHKNPNSDYGVIVPDLPGCYSAGSSVEEAIQNTHEAIECHLEGLLLDGDPIPLKKALEQHLDNPELKDGVMVVLPQIGELTQLFKHYRKLVTIRSSQN